METAATRLDPVSERIGASVRELRGRLGLSLDALAASSGVSRSALSLIERAESNPTATVLDKVASALDVPLASLFGNAHEEPNEPVSRRAGQVVWRDPSSGYVRRSISPKHGSSPLEIVEVTFPPGARVTFDTGRGRRIVHQQLWVLAGTIEVSLGETTHRLTSGDCLAMTLDEPTMFHNPTRTKARYAVVVATEPIGRR